MVPGKNKFPKKRSLLKEWTENFPWEVENFFSFHRWIHTTTSYTPKDAERSPHDPTYIELWETGVWEPFFWGTFFWMPFFPGTLFRGPLLWRPFYPGLFPGDFLSEVFFSRRPFVRGLFIRRLYLHRAFFRYSHWRAVEKVPLSLTI